MGASLGTIGVSEPIKKVILEGSCRIISVVALREAMADAKITDEESSTLSESPMMITYRETKTGAYSVGDRIFTKTEMSISEIVKSEPDGSKCEIILSGPQCSSLSRFLLPRYEGGP